MHTRLKLAFAVSLGFTTPAAAQATWQVSFIPGVVDPDGHALHATEVRRFAYASNPDHLYAAISGWMDQGEEKGGGKIIRLDGPDEPWRLEVDFDSFCASSNPKCALAASELIYLNWKADASGEPVDVWTLVASTWPQGEQRENVYVKNYSDGRWYETTLVEGMPGHIRAFATHKDAVTGEYWGFAGGNNFVFRGKLADKRGQGQNIIAWQTGAANAETDFPDDPNCGGGTGDGNRVAGFAEARGKLFLTVCWSAFERVDGFQEDCTPRQVKQGGTCVARWKKFWTDPKLSTGSETGLRGITQIVYEGQQVLLIGSEGAGAHMTRLDPETGQSVVELDLADALASAWRGEVSYIIAPYNAPMPIAYDAEGRGRRLIGLEAWNSTSPLHADHNLDVLENGSRLEGGAWFYLRNAASSYELRRIPWLMRTPMVAVRDAVASPFAKECDANHRNCWIYFAGFDANKSESQTPCFAEPCKFPPLVKTPTHDTGFIVKGWPLTP